MTPSALPALSAVAHARATQLSGAALRAAGPAEQRAAVAAQFEAILVRQLLGPTLTKMLDSGNGAAAGVYGDMLTGALATQLAAGQGLGLGRLIEQQLTPRTPPAVEPPAGTPLATPLL